MPHFSIIIPTFNAERTLNKALQSVFDQRYKDFEVIVIDGGSKDSTLAILDTHADHIAHRLSAPDKGVYDAINKGLDLAKGRWIYILGADDEIADARVLEKIAAIPLADESLIVGDVLYLNPASTKVRPIHHSRFGKVLRWKNSVHHQGCFYRRAVFDDFRYDTNLKVLGDYELNIRLWKNGATAVESGLLIARCEAQGLSKVFNRRLYSEELLIKKRHFTPLEVLIQYPWITMKYVWKNS